MSGGLQRIRLAGSLDEERVRDRKPMWMFVTRPHWLMDTMLLPESALLGLGVETRERSVVLGVRQDSEGGGDSLAPLCDSGETVRRSERPEWGKS